MPRGVGRGRAALLLGLIALASLSGTAAGAEPPPALQPDLGITLPGAGTEVGAPSSTPDTITVPKTPAAKSKTPPAKSSKGRADKTPRAGAPKAAAVVAEKAELSGSAHRDDLCSRSLVGRACRGVHARRSLSRRRRSSRREVQPAVRHRPEGAGPRLGVPLRAAVARQGAHRARYRAAGADRQGGNDVARRARPCA